MRSNAVYSYTREQCFAQYYGETKRHTSAHALLSTGLSARTGIHIRILPIPYNIRCHILDTEHEINQK